MKFENDIPIWHNKGTEPTEQLKTHGFTAGYKPPANVFNWFWNRTTVSISEMHEKLADVEKCSVYTIGTYTLTSLVAGVSASLGVTVNSPIDVDSWRVLIGSNDISGKLMLHDRFTTAPAIFEGEDVHVLFEKNDKTVFITDIEPLSNEHGELNTAAKNVITTIIDMTDLSSYMRASVYDADDDGVVDNAANAAKFGGNLPSYYAKKSELDGKANDSEVVKKTVGLPNALTLKMNGSTSTFKGTSAVSKTWYAPTTAGTAGQILKSNGSGAPVWQSTLPVANGGTGATTAAAALANLGITVAAAVPSTLEDGAICFVVEG